jgi:putative component of toxin-antitoxin plasmid stabilization module
MVIFEIRQTDGYARWFQRLRDRQAKARILVRIRRLSLGDKSTQPQDILRALELAEGV